MPAPITKAELFTLFPANGSLETEQARGLFLAALRLRDALLPAGLLAAVRRRAERQRTAQALEGLPDATLRDIGLTRAGIEQAANDAAARAILPGLPGRLQQRQSAAAPSGLAQHAA